LKNEFAISTYKSFRVVSVNNKQIHNSLSATWTYLLLWGPLIRTTGIEPAAEMVETIRQNVKTHVKTKTHTDDDDDDDDEWTEEERLTEDDLSLFE